MQAADLKGIFHCFSGTAEQLERIIASGFFAGIGGAVTFKNGGLDKVLQPEHLPYLVMETDAPYLAPVPFRGKRNEPAYLTYIVVAPSARDQFPLPSHHRAIAYQEPQSRSIQTTSAIGEAKRPVTRALVASMFLHLQMPGDLQSMTDTPTREHHEQRLQSRRKHPHGR